jgi:OPT family oligopeptide transporter
MNHPPDDPIPSFDETIPPSIPEEEKYEFPEGSDSWWLRNVYQGDRVPQLTLRAVVSGMLIGALMSISNLYVGLKTGWGLGVTVTACVIAFAVFKSLEVLIPAYRRKQFTFLENCSMTSTASAAGAISTAGLISAIPALYLCTGETLTWWQLMTWNGAVASLGLFMAIPLKRQLINVDKLPFPTGTATAETIRSLHSTGTDAMHQARALFGCALVGILVKMWVDVWRPFWTWLGSAVHVPSWGERWGKWALPETFPFWPGTEELLKKYTLGFEGSVLMMGAGAIMGIRIGCSMLIGAILFYGILAPIMAERGIIIFEEGKSAFQCVSTGWTLWPSVALMVTYGLVSFGLRWKTIARSFGELTAIFGLKSQPQDDPLRPVESPMAWFVIGGLCAGSACVILGQYYFHISWWMGVIAVLLSFVLAIVAARATGETDITPIGAMGKITQLTYGVLEPTSTKTNLMTAMITAGSSCHSADLLQALKAGYLIGANPRKQAIAQFFGVLAGVLVCVPVYLIIVYTPPFSLEKENTAAVAGKSSAAAAALATTEEASPAAERKAEPKGTNLFREFTAPAAAIWMSVAKILQQGFSKIPISARYAMIIGVVFGLGLALTDEFLPKKYSRWLPSATGLGIAGVITGWNSVSMFLGAFLAWIWMKVHRPSGERYIIAGSSGLIAGESLMGVSLSVIEAFRHFSGGR